MGGMRFCEDDAAARTSWIAASAPGDGAGVDVPAWTGGAGRWRKVVACVRAGFGPLAIDVVDEEPGGEFTRIMVGGRPAMLGFGDGVAGVAPSGDVLRGAVGFVFSANLDDDVASTCESVLHEVGHTLGLDHTRACRDLMSYDDCGGKTFLDEEVACGEEEARACDDGAPTQSSWRKLVAAVGLRGGATPVPVARDHGETETETETEAETEAETETATETETEAEAETETEAETEAETETETEAETATEHESALGSVAIVDLPDRVRGNRWLAIDIEARAASGVEDVALAWANGDERHAWLCSDAPGDDDVRCERDGDHVRFWIPAGLGTRTLVALARDATGHVFVGDARTLELTRR